jgi:hypothetical protein
MPDEAAFIDFGPPNSPPAMDRRISRIVMAIHANVTNKATEKPKLVFTLIYTTWSHGDLSFFIILSLKITLSRDEQNFHSLHRKIVFHTAKSFNISALFS